MYTYEEFLSDVLRIARQRGYRVEQLRGTSIPQIDFGHKKLHGGHLERLFPRVLEEGADIGRLIEDVAPGRPCAHMPLRVVLLDLRVELAMLQGETQTKTPRVRQEESG